MPLEPEISWVKRVQRQQRMQRSSSRTTWGPRSTRFCFFTLASRSRLVPGPWSKAMSWSGHSPPWSQTGQSRGWFKSQNSITDFRAFSASGV